MGIQQIVTSDYDGRRIESETKPTKLTIQRPGQTAKEAESFELYLNAADLEQFIDSLSDPAKSIIPPSRPSAAPVTRGRASTNTKPASELDQYKADLLKELDLTDQAVRNREQAWLDAKDWADDKKELGELINATDRADKDQLLDVLRSGKRFINAGVVKVARLHLGEALPE
ncbi:hypothetical protein [Nocardia sp. NPDC005366]|uniref:hypothetical protein n=1 Tax=Nocardia sp. NPDC005366 TaxID=3156878 RepID=UPI0033B526AA